MSGLKTGSAAKLEVGGKLQAMTIQTLLTAKSDPLQLAAVRSSYAVTRAVCHGGKDRHSTPTKQRAEMQQDAAHMFARANFILTQILIIMCEVENGTHGRER